MTQREITARHVRFLKSLGQEESVELLEQFNAWFDAAPERKNLSTRQQLFFRIAIAGGAACPEELIDFLEWNLEQCANPDEDVPLDDLME